MSAINKQNRAKQDSEEKKIHSELNHIEKAEPSLNRPSARSLEQSLSQCWEKINSTKDSTQFCSLIKQYCLVMLNSQDDEIFMHYFVEKKFMTMIKAKIIEHKKGGDVLKTVFSLFQFLLKALKKDEQLVYFLVKISQQGFVTEDYVFQEEEDEAYYVNFLKLMVRKINEDSKFLSVFVNSREPHFPLLLQLLKMHDSKDSIMLTSSKLAILQISNNCSPLVQTYMQNFPFVLFYPIYIEQILQNLKGVIKEDSPMIVEALQSNLKYMEDFVDKKEKSAINMYTNSFLKILGSYFYQQLINLNQKNIGSVIKLLKMIVKHVLPEIGVVKIRIGLFSLFAPLTFNKMQRCFQIKSGHLEKNYWIPDQCAEEVISHCKSVLYNQFPQNKSLLKAINSYIPRSKENWLFYELKKISDTIGYEIVLNEATLTEKELKQSFLEALQGMIDDSITRNDIFIVIAKSKNQEILYYYLRTLTELCNCQEAKKLIDFDGFISIMEGCSSVSLVQIFYNFVLKSGIKMEESAEINEKYRKVTEKLVHFILTKGWSQFLLRIKNSRLPASDIDFSPDIYREIQCDILLFCSLRTLLGTPNKECPPFQPQRWSLQPFNFIQTTIKCQDSSRSGPLVYAILDGQFINFKSCEQELINKQELLLSDMTICKEGDLIEVWSNPQKGNFSATFYIQGDFLPFFLKEVSNRREIANRVTLQLSLLKFEFSYE